jgi:hypothetical protein
LHGVTDPMAVPQAQIDWVSGYIHTCLSRIKGYHTGTEDLIRIPERIVI